jgi:ADP-heptose:LPS heptosyltransferase
MRLAIVCASGIGDALIFHTLVPSLQKSGWETTIFSNHLASFGSWLPPNLSLAPSPTLDEIEHLFSPFDAIFLQHDNSPKAFKIQTLKIPLFSFYGSHVPAKHGPFSAEKDYVCDRNQTMVENLRRAAERFFGLKTLHSGFHPPSGLIHRHFKRRIAIHPTASSALKMWPKEKFINVAKALKMEGYDPVFTVSPKEQLEWDGPLFPTLESLASFIYESGAFLGNDSGPGHLASLLNIPHLIVAGNGREQPLWKTGWHPGTCVTPPPYLMRFKLLRKHWELFVSEKSVIKNFKESALRN